MVEDDGGGDGDGGAGAGGVGAAAEVVVFLPPVGVLLVEAVDGGEGLEADGDVGGEDFGFVRFGEAEASGECGELVSAVPGAEGGPLLWGDVGGGLSCEDGVFVEGVGLFGGEVDAEADGEVGVGEEAFVGLEAGEGGGAIAVEEDEVGVVGEAGIEEVSDGVVSGLGAAGLAGVRPGEEVEVEVEVGGGVGGGGEEVVVVGIAGDDDAVGRSGLGGGGEEGSAEVAGGVGDDGEGEVGHVREA